MNNKMNTRDVPRPLHHTFPLLDGRDVQGPRLPGSALQGGKVRLGQDLNGKGERDNAVKTISEPICNTCRTLFRVLIFIKQQHIS